MSDVKLVWRTAPEPTGRGRSFEARGWPGATYDTANGAPAAMLTCADSYDARRRRSGNHAPLRVWIAVYRPDGKFDWRSMVPRASSFEAAQALVQRFLEQHPEARPKPENTV